MKKNLPKKSYNFKKIWEYYRLEGNPQTLIRTSESTIIATMSLPDLEQSNADDARILRIALEQHDPEMVDIAHQRMAKRFGKQTADSVVLSTVTKLIDKGWTFFREDGEPSPLLNHNLPE